VLLREIEDQANMRPHFLFLASGTSNKWIRSTVEVQLTQVEQRELHLGGSFEKSRPLVRNSNTFVSKVS
jgi:hypothetical protein